MRPFAVQLYQQFRGGKTTLELARETGIPLERIEQRIRAAEAYLQNRADLAYFAVQNDGVRSARVKF